MAGNGQPGSFGVFQTRMAMLRACIAAMDEKRTKLRLEMQRLNNEVEQERQGYEQAQQELQQRQNEINSLVQTVVDGINREE